MRGGGLDPWKIGLYPCQGPPLGYKYVPCIDPYDIYVDPK
jgi:hypothetical protein